MKLFFHKGTIRIEGNYNLPYSNWDKRANCYSAEALNYRNLIEYLENSNIKYEDRVLDLIPCPYLTSKTKLRDYQKEALERWLQQKNGIIILPTGSGKTILAIKIIQKINSPTFIVVPTLDLVIQWKEELNKAFDLKIGEFTGKKKDIQPITVSTYNSAFINAANLGNRFKLLIFDEVHHLPSEGFKQIAEMFASPFRLGLTATFERSDGLHEDLLRLIGGIIYEKKTEDLAGKYLSNYEIVKIGVDLTEEEKIIYSDFIKNYRNYLISRNIKIRTQADFKKIIMRSGYDPEARKAILSRNQAERIAYNSKNKIEKIRNLLSKKDRIIIFTRYNDMVYLISKEFFIPCITYKTHSKERKDILRKFKKGEYTAIVSSQVLDEGIDVPEANIGIIVSGTGSTREFIQRLGRLLRPRDGKNAILYELVSKNTMEVKISYRRKS